MAHKKKPTHTKTQAPYTIEDAMKITDDVFRLSKEKKYHPGAFIHGLVIALEYAQLSYNVPPQQIANIKRDCRKYLRELSKKQEKQLST
jgi:hypothetical protein